MGKTHLIQAVANHVIANNPKAVVRYVTCEQFLNSYLDSLHNKSVFHSHFEFRNYFREVDVLLIDDVHQLGGKEQLQEEFFNTFNTLHNAGKQIILTSDKQPSDIPGAGGAPRNPFPIRRHHADHRLRLMRRGFRFFSTNRRSN